MNSFTVTVTAVLVAMPAIFGIIGMAELVRLIASSPAIAAQSVKIVLYIAGITSFAFAIIYFANITHKQVVKMSREASHAMAFWPYK
jgi:hypothetical protein